MKNIVLLSQVSISLITPMLLGLFIGQKLDEWLNLNSIFTIALLLLGVVSGFVNTYKLITSMNSTKSRRKGKRPYDK